MEHVLPECGNAHCGLHFILTASISKGESLVGKIA